MPGEFPSNSTVARTLTALAAEDFSARPPIRKALPRQFAENAARIAKAHRTLLDLASRGESIPFEAEWLLDNYYVIDEVVRQSHGHLPRSYYRQLPMAGGVPRVYKLAESLIDSGERIATAESIRESVRVYQQSATLTIGELWAVPIMLRFAVIELLRRISDRILETVRHRRAAQLALKDLARGRRRTLPEKPTDAYAAAVWEAIREEGAPTEAIGDWVGRHLVDPHALSHREFYRQASNQLSIGNAVTTLRLLGVLDWKAFFESTSAVEAILRTDPAKLYPLQDFATRDRCRGVVEKLARGSGRPEADVARAALSAARQADRPGGVARVLIGEGRPAFAQILHYRPRLRDRPREWAMRNPGLVLANLLLGFTAVALIPAILLGATMPWPFAVVAIALALIPASELGMGLTNFAVRKLIPARVLPKLESLAGIPPECAAFVVVPTLIGKPEQAAALVERLEMHALSSPEPALSFALLTDFTDAATETLPDDGACTAALLAGIARLNATYCSGGRPQFFLFHRRRQYNASEDCWMGQERKRGKLDDFNRLLRGATDTSFAVLSCAPADVPKVKYVLTLDTDTVLPRDAARQMIATLAHPLNHPRMSADGRRVEAGYAILQPRVSFLYRAGFRSWFARLFAGSAGIDPYSSAASDTSMDLFARGSFTGKGLYDIDAFAATAGRAFPDNAVLSHDLVESNYARCALATDIEVFDEFPARYHAYARREHRWIRGDWQLLPWLGRTVPAADGVRQIGRAHV